jgi:hypothetical protein
MRFGANKNLRASLLKYLPAYAAAGVALCAELSTNAVAEILTFRPSFTVEQIFTDNVRADSGDRDADGVTVLSGSLVAQLSSARIQGIATGNLHYNEFWATDTLDNMNGEGVAALRAEVLRNLFFIDAIAQKQEIYISPNDIAASGLTTGQGSLQQTNYAVSPFITADLFGMADLLVRGNYAQVQFDQPVVGLTPTNITDITLKHVGGRLTTGNRSSLYEAIVTAEYMETDLGFEQRNVVGGLIFNLTKSFSAIGRIGYERISDPTLPTIRGQVWSLGGRFEMGDDALIQFEVGRRFDDDTYRGEFNFGIGTRTRVRGGYTDNLVPVQLTLVRGVGDLLDQDGNFLITVPNTPSVPDPLLVDGVVRDKSAEFTASYDIDLQTYTLSAGHSERIYPSLSDSEKFFFAALTLEEKLSRNLDYFVSVQFQDNYSVLATRTSTQSYRADFAFEYQYNESVLFAGGYSYRLLTSPADVDTYENIFRVSATQAF